MIRRHRVVLPVALAIGAIAAGCGSDDSGETSTTQGVSIPAVTSPIGTGTLSVTTSTFSTDTGTSTARNGKPYNPQLPDSETNDIPPKKGSPEEAFEQQCKQQGTCG